MPRIISSESYPHDFCMQCWDALYSTEEEAEEEFGDRGDGPDERGNCFAYNDDHPDYDDCDYDCDKCHEPLTSFDNYPPALIYFKPNSK